MSEPLALRRASAPSPDGGAAAPACGGCLVSRRGFLQLGSAALAGIALVGCGGGADDATGPGPTPPPPTNALPPGFSISGDVITVDVGVANDLTEDPGLVFILNRTRRPALLVRNGAGPTATYRGFLAVCPHAGNRDGWEPLGDDIQCGYHGSVFSRADGTVIAGVSPRGLTPLPTTRNGNLVQVNAG
jgi:nitrite reductase/ring-hydroxylating ferredoxin subunit